MDPHEILAIVQEKQMELLPQLTAWAKEKLQMKEDEVLVLELSIKGRKEYKRVINLIFSEQGAARLEVLQKWTKRIGADLVRYALHCLDFFMTKQSEGYEILLVKDGQGIRVNILKEVPEDDQIPEEPFNKDQFFKDLRIDPSGLP